MNQEEPHKEKEVRETGGQEQGFNTLVGFFDLLYTIDRRVNPHLYKNPKNDAPPCVVEKSKIQ